MKIRDRFIQVHREKALNRYEDMKQVFKLGNDAILEFQFLTVTLLASWLEFTRYGNSLGLRYRDDKLVDTLSKIINYQACRISDKKKQKFFDRLVAVTDQRTETFFPNVDHKYDNMLQQAEMMVTVQLILSQVYEPMIKYIGYKRDYIECLNIIFRYIEKFRDDSEKKKVSRFQHLVGKNLKNIGKGE
ncbi:MAG: hypothetical protein ACRC0G_00300 [Fusobacteriaceae bacterium]